MAIPFISNTDLADYRKEAVDNDLAIIATDAACQVVRDEIGQTLDRVVDDVVYVDSPGGEQLLLPQLPVEEVSEVRFESSGTVLTEGTDYVVDKELGALQTKRYGRRFLPGRKIYRVTYTHGWATVPSSVRLVALTLAARIYDQQLIRQESVGGYQAIYAAAESATLTAGEKAILAKHDPGRKRN